MGASFLKYLVLFSKVKRAGNYLLVLRIIFENKRLVILFVDGFKLWPRPWNQQQTHRLTLRNLIVESVHPCQTQGMASADSLVGIFILLVFVKSSILLLKAVRRSRLLLNRASIHVHVIRIVDQTALVVQTFFQKVVFVWVRLDFMCAAIDLNIFYCWVNLFVIFYFAWILLSEWSRIFFLSLSNLIVFRLLISIVAKNAIISIINSILSFSWLTASKIILVNISRLS